METTRHRGEKRSNAALDRNRLRRYSMTQRQKGALYMFLSALCFASMQVVVRLSREIPTMEQIFMRNSFVLIVSAQKGLAVRPGQVSALSVRAVVLWLSGPDHPVLCLQPCGAGRCDDPEQNFPYLGHHSGRHLYERKAAQDPDPGAGTFHGGCLHRVPPQL